MRKDDPRRGPLQAYVRQVADLFRLQAWDLEVVEGDPPARANMSIKPQPVRWFASIRVGEEFWECDAEEQRHVVCHELAHVVQGDLWEFLTEAEWWKQPLAPDHATAITEVVRQEAEKQADFFARLLAPHAPPVPSTWEPTAGG